MEKTDKKVFIFDNIKVFFKHTDFYGFVHPYNYYEWTSYVREAFFSKNCGNFKSVIDSKVKMMTAKIQLEVASDCSFGDDVEARLTVTKVKRVSLDVIVRFVNKQSKQLAAETRHTLVFVDSSAKQFTSVPESIKEAIADYQE